MDAAGARNRPDRDFPDVRRTLLEGSVAAVTLVSRSAPNAPARGYASCSEIALPYAGIFHWRVGRRVSAIDANCVLYISQGQEFSETHPLRHRGHAAAVIVPTEASLDEMIFSSSDGGRGFRAISSAASPRAQLLSNLLLHAPANRTELESDETAVSLLQELLHARPEGPGHASRKIVARAKTLMHDWVGERFSLTDAAGELGVSPIYLTHAFKLSEGVPLYRYYRRLRLAHALQAIPGHSSLSGLAMELGYSTHSHFTAAFHDRFGVTPSGYRAAVGAKKHPAGIAVR